jgi:hypothetical protein
VRSLSLFFALLAIPAAWWAGRAIWGTARAAWMAAVLVAFNPFLSQYAQEARMYSLIALLAIPLATCFLRAYALDADENRRPWIAGFALARRKPHAHNWAIFFTLACVAAWGVLFLMAPGWRRRELVRDGLLGFGGAFVLYLPWIPTTLYQAAHTGAPWSDAPAIGSLLGVPGQLLGRIPQIVLLICAGAGLLALWQRRDLEDRLTPKARAAAVLASSACSRRARVAMSQVSPAGRTATSRSRCRRSPARRRRLAHAAARARRPAAGGRDVGAGRGAGRESNVRASRTHRPSLAPGDLVISTSRRPCRCCTTTCRRAAYATLTGR